MHEKKTVGQRLARLIHKIDIDIRRWLIFLGWERTKNKNARCRQILIVFFPKIMEQYPRTSAPFTTEKKSNESEDVLAVRTAYFFYLYAPRRDIILTTLPRYYRLMTRHGWYRGDGKKSRPARYRGSDKWRGKTKIKNISTRSVQLFLFLPRKYIIRYAESLDDTRAVCTFVFRPFSILRAKKSCKLK